MRKHCRHRSQKDHQQRHCSRRGPALSQTQQEQAPYQQLDQYQAYEHGLPPPRRNQMGQDARQISGGACHGCTHSGQEKHTPHYQADGQGNQCMVPEMTPTPIPGFQLRPRRSSTTAHLFSGASDNLISTPVVARSVSAATSGTERQVPDGTPQQAAVEREYDNPLLV